MNRRIVHIICGGRNSGKTIFSRYLQLGKKNIFRICKEELVYSVGIDRRSNNELLSIASLLLKLGDIVLDDESNNKARNRIEAVKALQGEFVDVYAYIMKRPVEQCYCDYYSDKEIEASHRGLQFPTLKEGFTKIISVTWEDSADAMVIAEERLTIKPKLTTVHQIAGDRPIIVKPKKKTIKHKLRQDRRVFRLKNHNDR